MQIKGEYSIELCKKDLTKAKNFAEARIGGSKDEYMKRGEANVAKMIEDIEYGAMAELAVYRLLKGLKLSCTKPDFKIYEKRKKSYSPDLICNGLNLHVKSQGTVSAKRYGSSWLFQKFDPLIKNLDPKDILVLCIVDGNTVHVKNLIGFRELVKLELLDKPKVFQYAITKVAIYLEKLPIRTEKWLKKLVKQQVQ